MVFFKDKLLNYCKLRQKNNFRDKKSKNPKKDFLLTAKTCIFAFHSVEQVKNHNNKIYTK